ncbi:MAG: hypothetical protein II595_03715, partial [Desulfovibrio sp.]|nr:hypothetical protein [Desulfovibrio sp.]
SYSLEILHLHQHSSRAPYLESIFFISKKKHTAFLARCKHFFCFRHSVKQAGGLWPAQFSVQFSELFRGMLADDAAVNGEIAVAALAVRRGG